MVENSGEIFQKPLGSKFKKISDLIMLSIIKVSAILHNKQYLNLINPYLLIKVTWF